MKAGCRFADGEPRGAVEQDSSLLDITVLVDGVPVRPVLTVCTDVLTRSVLGFDMTFGSDDGIPID